MFENYDQIPSQKTVLNFKVHRPFCTLMSVFQLFCSFHHIDRIFKQKSWKNYVGCWPRLKFSVNSSLLYAKIKSVCFENLKYNLNS